MSKCIVQCSFLVDGWVGGVRNLREELDFYLFLIPPFNLNVFFFSFQKFNFQKKDDVSVQAIHIQKSKIFFFK